MKFAHSDTFPDTLWCHFHRNGLYLNTPTLGCVVDPVVELHGLLAGDEAVAQPGPLLLLDAAALDDRALVVFHGAARGRDGSGRRGWCRRLLRL